MKPLPATLFLLFIACLCIIPASAKIVVTAEPLGVTSHFFSHVSNMTYDASKNGEGIQRVIIDAPINSITTFTLYYSNGSYVSGSVQFNDAATIFGQGYVTSYISLGGVTSSYTYLTSTTTFPFGNRAYIQGYAKNETSTDNWVNGIFIAGGTAVITTFDNDVVFYPTTDKGDHVIYKIVVNSNRQINVQIMTNPRSSIASSVSSSWVDEAWKWINFGLKFSAMLYNFVLTFLYWMKFFFVDHLVLTVSGYIMLSMAFAAKASRGNMGVFFKRLISDQVALARFIIEMFRSFIEILSNFRSIFRFP